MNFEQGLLEAYRHSLKLNSSFSTSLAGLQVAIDSTSLGTAKECLRKYFFTVVLGFVPRLESPHLTFGLLLHKARELYDAGRLEAQALKLETQSAHDFALDKALDHVLRATWNKALNRPWASDHPVKNRMSLIRTTVWYLDSLGRNDALQTVILANGKPAVEVSFRFDTGMESKYTGEKIVFCGHLDRIANLNNQPYIVDIKTTSHELNKKFFSGFTPNNQFSMYALAGRVAFGADIGALIVDGAQIGTTYSRFERGLVQRDTALVNEWFEDSAYWVAQMGFAAEQQKWPHNDKSCDMYGGCPFREVCSAAPQARARRLETSFTQRIWDPLQIRGDI